jgi:hypothetical protein
VRWKARPTRAALREELADFSEDHAAGWASSSDPAFQAVGAGYRRHAQRIRDGAEIHLSGWEVPRWARGTFRMDDFLVLGEDNILRPDPRFSGS